MDVIRKFRGFNQVNEEERAKERAQMRTLLKEAVHIVREGQRDFHQGLIQANKKYARMKADLQRDEEVVHDSPNSMPMQSKDDLLFMPQF
jgi:hypothetical protein